MCYFKCGVNYGYIIIIHYIKQMSSISQTLSADPDSARNEKQYKLDLSFKKYIGSTDNALEADYWYKWKDYKFKPDTEQWTLNLSFEIKF